MNREILFRGKRLDNGEWVQGYYYKSWDDVYIALSMINGKPDVVQIDPRTVGQYTGLKDKNGVKIFVGDIVEEDGEKSVVSWIKEVAAHAFVPVEVYPDISFLALFEKYGTDTFFRNDVPGIYVEVIGNIHDNPELLEVLGDEA